MPNPNHHYLYRFWSNSGMHHHWHLLRDLYKTWRKHPTMPIVIMLNDPVHHHANPVASHYLRLYQEYNLLRYYGIRHYVDHKQKQQRNSSTTIPSESSSSSTTTCTETSMSNDSCSSSSVPSSSLVSSNTTTTTTSTSKNTAARIPFMVTARMKVQLQNELGYDRAYIAKLTPLEATNLLLQYEHERRSQSPQNQNQNPPQPHDGVLLREASPQSHQQQQQQRLEKNDHSSFYPASSSSPALSSSSSFSSGGGGGVLWFEVVERTVFVVDTNNNNNNHHYDQDQDLYQDQGQCQDEDEERVVGLYQRNGKPAKVWRRISSWPHDVVHNDCRRLKFGRPSDPKKKQNIHLYTTTYCIPTKLLQNSSMIGDHSSLSNLPFFRQLNNNVDGSIATVHKSSKR